MIQAWRKQVPQDFKLNNDELPGSNKRKEGESFKDYKIRRMVQNNLVKLYLKGRVFWDSEEASTYVKEE